MTRLDAEHPVRSLRALARPTAAELEARKRTKARRDLHPATGITQAELVARLGCKPSSVSASEKRGAGIGLDTLLKYAAACGVEVELVGNLATPAPRTAPRPPGSSHGSR